MKGTGWLNSYNFCPGYKEKVKKLIMRSQSNFRLIFYIQFHQDWWHVGQFSVHTEIPHVRGIKDVQIEGGILGWEKNIMLK